jgi:hypothetical protein
MKLHDCLNYVGLPSTESSVKELLLALGYKKEPKCKKSDPDFDWSNEEHCVELLFKDEDWLKNNTESEKYGLAPLILNAINIELVGDQENYPNSFIVLPGGLDFGVNRAVALTALGKSNKNYESGGKIRNDQWFFEKGRIVVTYNADTQVKRVAVVTTKYD